jgi:hypothetical protein
MLGNFLPEWLYSPCGPWPLFSLLFCSQAVGLLGPVISPSQGLYLNTAQHKHIINAHTDIHVLSGIRTHDHSVRASEDSLCLGPLGYCDRRVRQLNVPKERCVAYNIVQLLCFVLYPSSWLYMFKTMFRMLDSVSVFRWILPRCCQSTGLVRISGHQNQHKMIYINKAQHKPSVGVKTNIKNIERTPQTWGVAPISIHYFTAIVVKMGVLSE